MPKQSRNTVLKSRHPEPQSVIYPIFTSILGLQVNQNPDILVSMGNRTSDNLRNIYKKLWGIRRIRQFVGASSHPLAAYIGTVSFDSAASLPPVAEFYRLLPDDLALWVDIYLFTEKKSVVSDLDFVTEMDVLTAFVKMVEKISGDDSVTHWSGPVSKKFLIQQIDTHGKQTAEQHLARLSLFSDWLMAYRTDLFTSGDPISGVLGDNIIALNRTSDE